ncbi:MAG: thrombospondin type 3 repeat-containing protein [Myxococcales bacterium]
MKNMIKVAMMVVGLATMLWTDAAIAQMQDNPECLGTACGKPKEEGGGCGCGCGCSVWVAYTDDGDTLAYADDADGDGKADPQDNCPFVANRDQSDADSDGIGDACDNCPSVVNKEQSDIDGDGKGDACEDDTDGDTIPDGTDNCLTVANKDQKSTGGCPGKGDACCADADGDGIPNAQDNCPLVANPSQDIVAGATCTTDADKDGVPDTIDNCVDVANPDQKDTDKDGKGDLCDADIDGDSVLNAKDNCPAMANADQIDADKDGKGDACDAVFCFVVDSTDADACLNPKAPFAVSAGPAIKAKKGETVRLPIFANRNNVAMNFTWTVAKRPAGSEAAISNPIGSVSASRDWQYAYPNGEVPTFVADADGTFEFQLAADLVFPDRVYPEQVKATSTTKLVAEGGEGLANSCSTAFGAPLIPLALLGLAALRRRQ